MSSPRPAGRPKGQTPPLARRDRRSRPTLGEGRGPRRVDSGRHRKVSELALQGREGEARARAQLEPRVWSGRASVDEIRMLRAICKHMGDRACSDRATALLAAQK